MPASGWRITSSRSAEGSDAGVGLIGTLVGVVVILSFLLLAVQVVLGLYETSMVTAAGFDAARLVAGSAGGEANESAAEDHARSLLGARGAALRFEWAYRDTDSIPGVDVVELHLVAAPRRPLLPLVPDQLLGVDRTFVVRIEQVR